MAQTYWDSLVINLNKQLNDYDQLIQLLHHENQYLIQNQTSLLPEIISQQDFLTTHLDRLNDEKNTISSKIMVGATGVTLSQLISIAPPPINQEIKTLQMILQKKTRDLQQVSHTNTRLIESSLKYVDYMMNLISRESSKHIPVYSARGIMQEKDREAVLDYMG